MRKKYNTALKEDVIKALKKKAIDDGVRPNSIIEKLLEKHLMSEGGERMRFISDKHEKNYNEVMSRANILSDDIERVAMIYIFTGNEDLYKKISYLYDFEENSIKNEVLTDGAVDFSSSSRKLVICAFNLYNNFYFDEEQQTILNMFSSLDKDNFELLMNAICIRFRMKL